MSSSRITAWGGMSSSRITAWGGMSSSRITAWGGMSSSRITAWVVAGVALLACGGGGGAPAAEPRPAPTGSGGGNSSELTPPPAGAAVDAGYGRIAPVRTTIRLRGSSADGRTLRWTQVAGTQVALDDPTIAAPSFVTPEVSASETLTFELAAEDESGRVSRDRVSVEVWVPTGDPADPTSLGDFTGRAAWTCDVDPITEPRVSANASGDVTTYESNGIPSHATGTFPNGGNPNRIATFPYSYDVPSHPRKIGVATEMAEFGITLDGIKLERDTAESYRNTGRWRYEAITRGLSRRQTPGARFSWLGTDCNNAHVQPTGAYHYHGIPEGLINRLGEESGPPDHMILGGYAADGFPIYLRYGHADPADAESDLVVMRASWELKPGSRPSGPGGAYDGTFREAWEYVAGSGDLDECGGRFGVTPEYPGGIYHYFLTDDYPFIPRCVFGIPDPSFRSMRGRGAP